MRDVLVGALCRAAVTNNQWQRAAFYDAWPVTLGGLCPQPSFPSPHHSQHGPLPRRGRIDRVLVCPFSASTLGPISIAEVIR